jgi:hypothetical protein
MEPEGSLQCSQEPSVGTMREIALRSTGFLDFVYCPVELTSVSD